MENKVFETENGVLKKYTGSGERAVVPCGVTEIYEYAFAENRELKEIILPDGVRKIGQYAFFGCPKLRTVKFGAGLERIERFAFWECGGLEIIALPEGTESIGKAVFRGCDMLRRVVLPDSVTDIGESAFSDCSSIGEINIPKDLTVIKKRVFSDCKSLISVYVPDGVRELDDYAFECCDLLSEIRLPGGLEKIGKHAFDGCSSLKEIDVPKSVKSVGSSAFHNTLLTDGAAEDFVIVGDGILIKYNGSGETAEIPNGVRQIGERAFAYCENLKSAAVPEGVVKICDYAFESCGELSEVSLPQSLERIGDGAFSECRSIEKIKLPQNVLSIGTNAFYGTRMLENAEGELAVFGGKYLICYTGEEERFAVSDGITVIADSAFSGRYNLKSVSFGKDTAVIGERAFQWCSNLAYAEIPSGVSEIGAEAFVSSGGLHAVIERGARTVGESAFAADCEITFADGEKRFTVTLEKDMTNAESDSERALLDFAANPNAETFAAVGNRNYMLPAAICFFGEDEAFGGYLAQNMRAAVCLAVDGADSELMQRVLNFGLADAEDLSYCIDYAIEKGRTEQQAELMRFKHEHFGDSSVGDIIDGKFRL